MPLTRGLLLFIAHCFIVAVSYKMCVRAYLNGDGSGYNTHFSVFFVLVRGEFDPLLKWPFEYKVSLGSSGPGAMETHSPDLLTHSGELLLQETHQ